MGDSTMAPRRTDRSEARRAAPSPVARAILRRVRRLAVLAFGALLLVGCQSTRSWQQGCPGIYSGVRYYADIRPEVPWDGRIFFTIDLIPTSIVDTLALPVTAFLKPKRPLGGFPVGCRWANPRARERRTQRLAPPTVKS